MSGTGPRRITLISLLLRHKKRPEIIFPERFSLPTKRNFAAIGVAAVLIGAVLASLLFYKVEIGRAHV